MSPNGYYLEWSGQYENLIRGERTLMIILPIVLLVIFLSLYLAFNSIREAFFSLITVPFALIGGAYMVYFYGVNLSVAVAVGFIALFGIAVETGVVMVIYLNDAMQQLIKLRGNSSRNNFKRRVKGICSCRRCKTPASQIDDCMCRIVWPCTRVVVDWCWK